MFSVNEWSKLLFLVEKYYNFEYLVVLDVWELFVCWINYSMKRSSVFCHIYSPNSQNNSYSWLQRSDPTPGNIAVGMHVIPFDPAGAPSEQHTNNIGDCFKERILRWIGISWIVSFGPHFSVSNRLFCLMGSGFAYPVREIVSARCTALCCINKVYRGNVCGHVVE